MHAVASLDLVKETTPIFYSNAVACCLHQFTYISLRKEYNSINIILNYISFIHTGS